MTKISRLAGVVAALAVAVVSPAIAHPQHKMAHRGGHNGAVTLQRSGRGAFALVPSGRGANDPALTGGGSSGYNKDIGDDI